MELAGLTYFAFLIPVVLVFHIIPASFRKTYLLWMSVLFLSLINPGTLILFLATSFATQITFNRNQRLGIALNILSLLALKVVEFQFNEISFLPVIGLSFYVLQNVSLLVENIHGSITQINQKDLLLWQAFFPKMIAGPILSVDDINNEVRKSEWKGGIYRITLGVFKKLVIAERIGVSTNSVLDHYWNYSGLTIHIGILLFFIQLYFEFSGYVDIAIGSGKLLGINMPENFRTPLRSLTVSDFWRRWHMTLMTWLLNHIYYPLSYHWRKYKTIGFIIPILLVFLASGLWSGIHPKYIFCVMIFAGAIILERFLKVERFKNVLLKGLWYLISFNILAIGFSFFKWDSLLDGMEGIGMMFSDYLPQNTLSDVVAPLGDGASLNEQFNLYTTLIISIITLIIENKINNEKNAFLKISLMIVLILLLGNFTDVSQFIYMQFS